MLRLRSLFGALANVAHTHRRLIAIVLAALLLRVALLPLYARLPNGYLDEGFWKFWMRTRRGSFPASPRFRRDV